MLLSLTNVSSVLADEGTPTEPPPAEVTNEPTEPPAEATEVPVDTSSVPAEVTEAPVVATEAPVAATEVLVEESKAEAAVEEVLSQLPEDANIVVLDADGNAVSLASQEATDIILDTDPMWCPAGALPGDPGCTTNFVTVGALVTDMRNTDMANSLGSTYTQDGIIYFTSSVTGSLNLTTGLNTVFANNYDTIKNFNLTLQGGWNGANGASATFTGQTDFGTNRINIGPSSNPWVGSITLNNFTFSNATGVPITVRTTTGDITLNNVHVVDQSNATFTGQLVSDSGDITVQNSSFDGNLADQSKGFTATTTSGSITVSDTTFQESRRNSASATYEGAQLSAPTITLTNVTAINNDGSGILATNYDLLTLNNVIANNNGKEAGSPGLLGNHGAGVEADGNVGSTLIIIGGSFNNNKTYGYEVTESTVYIQSNPVCTGNVGGCTDYLDDNPPDLTLPADLSLETTDPTGATVNYSASATDNIDGSVTVTCTPPSGSFFPIGITTVTCEATDTAGNIATESFDVEVTLTESSEEETSEGEVAEEEEEDEGEASQQSISNIPVTGGNLFDIPCPPSSFIQMLEGAQVIFTNLCGGYQGTIDQPGESGLPGDLPNGQAFISGLAINVLKDGEIVNPLPKDAKLTIGIQIPDNASNEDFVVMFWDGEKWVEVDFQQTADGYFQFISMQGGIFILLGK